MGLILLVKPAAGRLPYRPGSTFAGGGPAMRIPIGASLFAAALLGLALDTPAQDRRPFSLDRRVPWTTSQVRGSPDPPAPYRTENAFPRLKFDEPLELAAVPGSDRWVV